MNLNKNSTIDSYKSNGAGSTLKGPGTESYIPMTGPGANPITGPGAANNFNSKPK